jgi:hypothetical protein
VGLLAHSGLLTFASKGTLPLVKPLSGPSPVVPHLTFTYRCLSAINQISRGKGEKKKK